MKLTRIGLVLVLGALLIAPSAQAAEFIAPEGDDGTITLPSDETHKNVYVAGGNIAVNSATQGDLFIAGGNITVEGNVEQDLVIGGGTIAVNGNVGGDLRVGGGTVNVRGTIGGDVLAGAGTIFFSQKAAIGGDLVVGGGEVVVDGPVTGNVRIAGGQVTINNTVLGDVSIEADSLTFGSKASVAGKITYRGKNEAVIKEGASVAAIDFQKVEARRHAGRALSGIFTVAFVIKILAAMLAAFVFLKLRPRRFRRSIDLMYRLPWSNLGIGALGLIVIPILSVLLLVTFVGWYIGLIALLLYAILLLASGLLASVFVGSLILKLLTKQDRQLDWQAVVIGVVAMAIIKLIPIVGWLACLVVMLIAFGALMRMYRDDIKEEQQLDTPPVSV